MSATSTDLQPVVDGRGATILGPRNVPVELENPDVLEYYLKGQGRMTVFASGGKARTFDYQAGDVGYVPFAMGHYVENTGEETLTFLEMFRSDHFADVSLSQRTGVLPPELVKAHLTLDDAVIAALPRTEPIAVRQAS